MGLGFRAGRFLVLPPLSNSWMTFLRSLYTALNSIPITDWWEQYPRRSVRAKGLPKPLGRSKN